MPNIYELPPSTGTGDAEQQLRELRNFLFRMVRQLNAASETTKGEIVSAGRNGIVLAPNGNENNGSKPNDQTMELVRKQGRTLRALITKTADEVRSYMDVITAQLKSEYVAVSDFGEYTETVNTTIEQTAKATIESYNYDAMLQELSDGLDAIGTYVTNIRGEIRRGFVEVDKLIWGY